MSTTAFIFLAPLILVSAVSVILWKNPIASALSLVVTLVALAVSYFLLDAAFVGILQILVYAGAVMVLFIFVIMLINLKEDELESVHWSLGKGMQVIVLAAFVLGAGVFLLNGNSPEFAALGTPFGDAKSVGRLLFTRYLLSFEMVSFVILVAIIAAIVLARRGEER